MPTYEYECLECKHRFDVFQSINDDPVEHCVKCNGRVRKLFTSAGIIFKGSGFYVNDHKGSGVNGKSGKKHTESGSASTGATEPSTTASCSGGSADQG